MAACQGAECSAAASGGFRKSRDLVFVRRRGVGRASRLAGGRVGVSWHGRRICIAVFRAGYSARGRIGGRKSVGTSGPIVDSDDVPGTMELWRGKWSLVGPL